MQLNLVSIVLYPQNLKRSRPVDSNTGMPGNTLSAWRRRGSNIHQSSVRLDLAAVKVLIRRTGQEEFHVCDIRDAHSATHGTLAGKTNPQCHRKLGCPEAIARPTLSSEWSTARIWPVNSTVPDNSLRCVLTAQVMTTRRSILVFGVRLTCRHVPPPTNQLRQLNQPSTYVTFSGLDRGQNAPIPNRK